MQIVSTADPDHDQFRGQLISTLFAKAGIIWGQQYLGVNCWIRGNTEEMRDAEQEFLFGLIAHSF